MSNVTSHISRALCFAGISVAAHAQTTAPPAFEAATVKLTAPTGGLPRRARMNGGPGTSDAGRIDYQSITLGSVVQRAYDLPFYRVSAPAWFNMERYDISAKIPEGATEEQFRQMLQNLLAERLKLAAHREVKEMPIYQLTVAKAGPKFKAWSADDERKLAEAAANPGPRVATADANGYPVLPAGQSFSVINNGHARLKGEKELMPNLAEFLSGIADRPVFDATNLKGEYAFTLSWIIPIPGAPPPPADSDPGPDLFTALREQLGLNLESKRMPVEVLVVDRAQKTPVEN